MKYTKKRASNKKDTPKKEATWDKFRKQQNELNADRRGVRR